MKVLLFSDLHLDTAFAWATSIPDLGSARRSALRTSLEKIINIASDRQVDAVLCAGDLYESDRSGADTATFLLNLFGSLDMPVLLSPGNHDYIHPRSIYVQNKWSKNVFVFSQNLFTAYNLTDGFTVWGAAHTVPANTPNLLQNFKVTRGGTNMAVFHGSEMKSLNEQQSGKLPHSPFTLDQIQEAGFFHACVGHYHKPAQSLWHTYPGNPDPLAFGESSGRGAVLLTIENEETTREVLDVSTSVITEINVDITKASNTYDVEQLVESYSAGCVGIVRINLVGSLHPEIDINTSVLSKRVPRGVAAAIVRSKDLTIKYDWEKLANEESIRGTFVALALEEGDLSEYILEAGVKALDGSLPSWRIR